VEGVKCYQAAADQGYAKAQYYMGVANYYGQGVETTTDIPEDFEAAVQWYQLSADQGYAPAQSNLGFCYQVGKGCSLQMEEAEKYFKLAAAQGDAYASAKLGSLQDFMVAAASADA
jgi:TPR repeat protein